LIQRFLNALSWVLIVVAGAYVVAYLLRAPLGW
jgi:hypothetical protein